MQTLDFLSLFPKLETSSPIWKKQQEFIYALTDETGYVGGFGSGKTLSGCLRTYLLCNHIPGNRIIVARRTYRELQDSTKRTFMEWLPPELYLGERKSDDIVFLRDRSGGASEVWFRSLNNPEKFKSAEIGAAFVDESTEASIDEVQLLKSRLRLSGTLYRPIYFTTNPCNKSHWMFDKFVTKAQEGITKLVRASTYENRHNLPPGYIEELERTYPADWIEVYLKGEFGITLEGLPVTPGFRKSTEINGIRVPWHVASVKYDPELPIKRGWDPGRVRPACGVWQVGKNGQWRKLWEKLGNNQPGNIFIPLVKNELNDRFPGAYWQDFADPQVFEQNKEDGRSWADELQRSGISVERIPRTSPGYRADVFGRMLEQTTNDGQPLVVIDPFCDISIEAYMGGYHKKKPELGKAIDDEPVKDGYYEHIVDADQYIIVGAYKGAGQMSKASGARMKEAAGKRARSYGGKR